MKLGELHALHERAATEASQATSDAGEDDARMALMRWPHIVAAMRQLVATYNQAAGRAVIDVAEDPSASSGPTLILRAGADDAATLSVTLEGAALYARRPGSDRPSREREYRLSDSRSDEATAAYVLQDWMAHL